MSRAYRVGLAVPGPQRGRANRAPSIHSGFATTDPGVADLILTAAVASGAYSSAMIKIYGCGLNSYAQPFPTVLGSKLPVSDMWALVIYDERAAGLRKPPYILFGSGKHLPGAIALDPDNWAKGRDIKPMGSPEHPEPGYVPYERVQAECRTLFVSMSLAADLVV